MALLEEARASQRRRLTSKPNVVGTMLGVKLTDGVPAHTRSIVVAVRTKVLLRRLKSHDRIPLYVAVRGIRIPVDVLPLPAFVPQAFARPLACSDQKTKATVTAIGLTPAGPVGVTCAHALKGLDHDIFTRDVVSLWSSELRRYVPVGHSELAVYSSGLGISADYGFSDAGTITLEDSLARRLHVGLKPLPIWRGNTTGGDVVALGSRGPLRGQIHGVRAEMFGGFCDVGIRVANGGTRAGDSGLLWRNADGAAVGMHAWGSAEAAGAPSKFSICMHPARVSKLLGVTLLDHF